MTPDVIVSLAVTLEVNVKQDNTDHSATVHSARRPSGAWLLAHRPAARRDPHLCLRTPFDGCEIQAGYGHRWPDKLGSHSAVEIPFTGAGRRFFADRAAARDLSLFLTRTAGMREMRREPTAMFAQWLDARFSPRVVELPSASSTPPPGEIGYRVMPSSVLFRRVSSTGRVFTVVIGKEGGVASQNVKPLAFVY